MKVFLGAVLETTPCAEVYNEKLSDQGKLLMKRLEERFAMYFFRAIDSNNDRAEDRMTGKIILMASILRCN